eukprot:768647-Hanusia_phi.AAC.5
MDQSDGIDVLAAMNLLRGKVVNLFSALGLDGMAVICCHPKNKLVGVSMGWKLTNRILDLLNTLHFKDSEIWLQAMYKSRMEKYDLSVDKPLQLDGKGIAQSRK